MEIRLDGARTLVTGGNSGIGAAIARALGQAGARVAINWVQDPDAAESVADDVRDAGPDALTVEADVSDPEAVEEMFGRIDDAWGGLDLLVNNAGIDGPREVAWEADVDAWRKVLEINLFGTFLCANQALRRMVEAGSGVILNVSSVHERIPWHGYSAYAAAKAGVSMLTKTLALEAAPEGVRVLAIAPGAVSTPINQDVRDDPDQRRDLLSKIPAGRIGDTEDIARMAVVLASRAAGYVTGTTVFVDGGMTLYPAFSHGG